MFALNVLAVTADPSLRSLIDKTFTPEGHRLRLAANDTEALLALDSDYSADLVLRDSPRHEWSSRLQTADYFRFINPMQFCMLLDSGDAAFRQFAVQLGVKAILTKPILKHDLHNLVGAMRPMQATQSESTSVEIAKQKGTAHIEELPNGRFFLADCPAMRQILNNIRLLAPVDVPVLILGESGVGKEIVSMLLHKYSIRAQRGFMNVNCAALPSDLLESELFGYEAGAFTGATRAKPGKFELADKGTILLDEIGEMSAPMQAKLLHVLQDGQFSKLGARSSTHVDVRVLAATNINMEEAIADRRFREDLFYRLNAFSLHIPPLRERREEIPALLVEIFRRQARDLNRAPIEVSPALLEAAQEYSWPGNLRELTNFATRILVLRDEAAAVKELICKAKTLRANAGPAPTEDAEAPVDNGMRSIVRQVRHQAEIKMIQEALQASGWNRRRAALDLHISYRSLLYKIQQYGLAPTGRTSSLRL